MPLDPNLSDEQQMAELMQGFKATGKIGNTTPKNPKHAAQIAAAIVSRMRETTSRPTRASTKSPPIRGR